MQIILTKDVDALGSNGDIVEVADGYYRNYLGPRNMAVCATKGALEDLGRRRKRIQEKAEKKHQEDLAKAALVNNLQLLTLEANVGESGKLYGTITTKELTRILQEKTGLEIERRNVNVDHPINKVGEYNVYVKFSARVSAQVKLQVNSAKAPHEAFALEDAFAGEEIFEEE